MKVKIQKTIEKNVTIPNNSDLGMLIQAYRVLHNAFEVSYCSPNNAVELVLHDDYGNECTFYFDKETFESVSLIPES